MSRVKNGWAVEVQQTHPVWRDPLGRSDQQCVDLQCEERLFGVFLGRGLACLVVGDDKELALNTVAVNLSDSLHSVEDAPNRHLANSDTEVHLELIRFK